MAQSRTASTASHGGRSTRVPDLSIFDVSGCKVGQNRTDRSAGGTFCILTMVCRFVSAALSSAFSSIEGVLTTTRSRRLRANSEWELRVVSPSNVLSGAVTSSVLGLGPDFTAADGVSELERRLKLSSFEVRAARTCSIPARRSSMRSIFFVLFGSIDEV